MIANGNRIDTTIDIQFTICYISNMTTFKLYLPGRGYYLEKDDSYAWSGSIENGLGFNPVKVQDKLREIQSWFKPLKKDSWANSIEIHEVEMSVKQVTKL